MAMQSGERCAKAHPTLDKFFAHPTKKAGNAGLFVC